MFVLVLHSCCHTVLRTLTCSHLIEHRCCTATTDIMYLLFLQKSKTEPTRPQTNTQKTNSNIETTRKKKSNNTHTSHTKQTHQTQKQNIRYETQTNKYNHTTARTQTTSKHRKQHKYTNIQTQAANTALTKKQNKPNQPYSCSQLCCTVVATLF